MRSLIGSTFTPSSKTFLPLTITRPSEISSSACLRLARPQSAMYLFNRTLFEDSLGFDLGSIHSRLIMRVRDFVLAPAMACHLERSAPRQNGFFGGPLVQKV